MKNLEGIRNVEVKESSMEKASMHVLNTGLDNFEDCALSEKDRLERIKAELINFEDCAKTSDDDSVKASSDVEIEETYDDCWKSR